MKIGLLWQSLTGKERDVTSAAPGHGTNPVQGFLKVLQDIARGLPLKTHKPAVAQRQDAQAQFTIASIQPKPLPPQLTDAPSRFAGLSISRLPNGPKESPPPAVRQNPKSSQRKQSENAGVVRLDAKKLSERRPVVVAVPQPVAQHAAFSLPHIVSAQTKTGSLRFESTNADITAHGSASKTEAQRANPDRTTQPSTTPLSKQQRNRRPSALKTDDESVSAELSKSVRSQPRFRPIANKPKEQVIASELAVRGTAPRFIPLDKGRPVLHTTSDIGPLDLKSVAEGSSGAKRVRNVLREIQAFWQRHAGSVKEATATVKTGREASLEPVRSVPRSQDIHSERLGGTETISRKDDRWKREEISADHAPRSFWGVKVVKEVRPKPLEEPARVTTPDIKSAVPEKATDGVTHVALKQTQRETARQPHRAETRTDKTAPKQSEINTGTQPDALQTAKGAAAELKQNTVSGMHVVEHTSPKSGAADLNHERNSETNARNEAAPKRSNAKGAETAPRSIKNETSSESPRPFGEEHSVSSPWLTQPSKDLSNTLSSSTLPSNLRFTVEQIKELQTLVSKSLQGARVTADGGREAVFNWNHDALGPLSFRITTRNDDVEIRIHSGRQEVAEALEEGRGTIERMIADLGLKVERFEVKHRPEAMTKDLANQAHEREHPDHSTGPDSETGSDMSLDLDLESEPETALPSTIRAEREWLA